jgi:hypothetical protein
VADRCSWKVSSDGGGPAEIRAGLRSAPDSRLACETPGFQVDVPIPLALEALAPEFNGGLVRRWRTAREFRRRVFGPSGYELAKHRCSTAVRRRPALAPFSYATRRLGHTAAAPVYGTHRHSAILPPSLRATRWRDPSSPIVNTQQDGECVALEIANTSVLM